MDYKITFNGSLYHHGIKGQKWGIRHYRNEDGSLTAAGKKRYGKMSGKKIYKILKKQVREERAKQNGSSNRWMSRQAIGKNSKKLIEENEKKWKEYDSSKAYKKWEKEVEDFERKNEDLLVNDPQKYNKKWEELSSRKPKKDWNILEATVAYGVTGKEYVGDYLNKGGKDLSIAYIKDLGYNEKVAKEFVDKMIKSNRTLGDV